MVPALLVSIADGFFCPRGTTPSTNMFDCLLVWANVGKANPPSESWSSGLTPASVRKAAREAASGLTRSRRLELDVNDGERRDG
jgi:hypothetical protein